MRGKGLLGLSITVALATPATAQAAQSHGASALVPVGRDLMKDAVVGTVSSVATGGVVVGGAAAAGTTVVVSGTAVTGLAASTGVGAMVLAVASVSYAAGTWIGETEVAGASIHTHMGNAMYAMAPSLFDSLI